MNGVRIGIRRTGNEPRRKLPVVMNKKVEWGVLGVTDSGPLFSSSTGRHALPFSRLIARICLLLAHV